MRNCALIISFIATFVSVGNYAAEISNNTNLSSIIPNLILNNSTFPFDTTVNFNCQGSDSCSIIISRYSTVIYFECSPGFAICPENDYCDFLLQKEPIDSTSHLIQTAIDDYCQPHNTFHNANIQYIVKTDSLNLFMEVVTIYDSVSYGFSAVSAPNKKILIKFDTTSFISKTALISVGKNKIPQTGAENFQDLKIQYYDIMGRILPTNLIYGTRSPFANKIIITNKKKILFQ